MSHDSDLSHELKALRRGRGIERTDLGRHLGPELRRRCRLGPADPPTKVRAEVSRFLRELIRDLPTDMRPAANAAFGLDQSSYFSTLDMRIRKLADAENISPRTARRRIDEATESVARAAEDAVPSAADTDHGWRVAGFRALFRLDTDTPELYELRRIVATREIDEVLVRFTLPPTPGEDELSVDAMFGARVLSLDNQAGNGTWYVRLQLPFVLPPGEEHEFWLRVVLPPGRPIWSHYAMVPVDPCDSCTIQVRFPAERLPADIWLLDGVPYTDLCSDLPAGQRIQPTPVGDIKHEFGRLRAGLGYGIGWTGKF